LPRLPRSITSVFLADLAKPSEKAIVPFGIGFGDRLSYDSLTESFVIFCRYHVAGFGLTWEKHMTKRWNDMTYHDKLDSLRGDVAQIRIAIGAITSNMDETWDAMRGARSELDRIAKDIGTLKALWPYSPKKYSRVS